MIFGTPLRGARTPGWEPLTYCTMLPRRVKWNQEKQDVQYLFKTLQLHETTTQMQSKPLTPPTFSQERATHQQSCQQCECTMTALNSTAVHCSGSNCGKEPLCTKFWCKSVSLTVTRTFLTPPYKGNKGEKNNFPNNCFCGFNNSTSDVHEVLKYKRGRVKITNSFSAKQAVNMLYCLDQNKHDFFHLILQEGTFKWGQCHRNTAPIVAFLKLRLNKIRRAVRGFT